jgi:hypothetical protein
MCQEQAIHGHRVSGHHTGPPLMGVGVMVEPHIMVADNMFGHEVGTYRKWSW